MQVLQCKYKEANMKIHHTKLLLYASEIKQPPPSFESSAVILV